MKVLVSIFGRLFYIPYRLAVRFEKERNLKIVKKLMTIAESSKIAESAKIRNFQNDRTKIILGSKTMLMGELLVFKHGGQIEIGNDCFIGEGTRIWSAKNITIGNRVLIAHNVNIHDQISHPLDSKIRHDDYKLIFEKGLQDNVDYNEKEVVIEDDVWIGFNVTILKGVKIGKGAIIGADTLIAENVPAFAVVIGNPARIIKYTT
ncbi:MAG: acyltransferase [Bacteroidota bacterium]